MYKLEKISDDKFNGKHPNGIFTGDLRIGRFYKLPTIGERFHFGTNKDHPIEHLWTSKVTKKK